MKLTVSRVKHVLSHDIDSTGQEDVEKLDGFLFSCATAAIDALSDSLPPGFVDFEREHLKLVIDGLRHSHVTIRKVLKEGKIPSAVDVLAVARLQLETLYSICFMLQDPANVRLFVKSGWKKKYIRFLLEREERAHLPRFSEYFSKTALPLMQGLQQFSGVSEEERQTIEYEQLDIPIPPGFQPVPIGEFPTPARVIRAIKDQHQKEMLERLYPEYQYLCSFAHGDTESTLFKTVLNHRSPFQKLFFSSQIEDVFQRQIAEPAILYSVISTVQVATEIAALYPSNVSLLAKVTEAWNWLIKGTLLASPMWERRAKYLLPLL